MHQTCSSSSSKSRRILRVKLLTSIHIVLVLRPIGQIGRESNAASAAAPPPARRTTRPGPRRALSWLTARPDEAADLADILAAALLQIAHATLWALVLEDAVLVGRPKPNGIVIFVFHHRAFHVIEGGVVGSLLGARRADSRTAASCRWPVRVGVEGAIGRLNPAVSGLHGSSGIGWRTRTQRSTPATLRSWPCPTRNLSPRSFSSYWKNRMTGPSGRHSITTGKPTRIGSRSWALMNSRHSSWTVTGSLTHWSLLMVVDGTWTAS